MSEDRRRPTSPDRRKHARGGRRADDPPGQHPRVLVADSYEAARRPCSRYLEAFAFQVAAFGDNEGDAIVREIGENRPAVVLMGTNLTNPPAGRLLEFATATAHVPVILLADSAEQAPAADLSSAAAVLVKPFTLGGMVDTVRRVLRSSSVQAAH